MKQTDRFGAMLVLLLVAYLVPTTTVRPFTLVLGALFVGVLVIVILDPALPRWVRIVGWIGVPVSLGSSIVVQLGGSTGWQALSHYSNSAVLCLSMLLVLERLTRSDTVTLSTVLGAVLAYALFALSAASLYQGVDVTDGPFFAQGEVADSDFQYFSIVVVTTLGFGDLSPGTDLAKRLVALEAFIGQLFVVILVARLVSLWRVPTHRRALGSTDSATED